MKKILLLLLVAMSVSLSGFAQKGRQAVGVDILPSWFFKTGSTALGGGIKYQYYLTDYIRLNPNINYARFWYQDSYDKYSNYLNSLQIGTDLDVFLTPYYRFRPYIITGIYYQLMKNKSGNEKRPAINLGIGLDYRITYELSLQAELSYNSPVFGINKYVYSAKVFHYRSIKLGIGLTYNF